MYARLMTDMEDYQSRGINPKRVEDWENSRRSPCAKDCWEAWDFDATLDDGAVLSLRVATKDGASIHSAKDAPVIRLSLVRGDGTLVQASRSFAAADCTWDEQELDIHCDDCELSGTLRSIHLAALGLKTQEASAPAQAEETAEAAAESAGSAETEETAETSKIAAESTTISLNLDFTALTRPVRPATGILDMGHDGKRMLGWVCPMPLARVEGTVVIGDETHAIAGTARHSHAWGTVTPSRAINDWLVVSQDFGERMVMLLDATSSSRSGFIRFPMIFVMNKRGNLLYSNTLDSACTAETDDWYDDPETGTAFPSAVAYSFDTPDGVSLRYELRGEGPLSAPEVHPCGSGTWGLTKFSCTDARFRAAGTLSITSPDASGVASETEGSDSDVDSYDGADLHLRTAQWTGETCFACGLVGKTFNVEHSPQITTEYAFEN